MIKNIVFDMGNVLIQFKDHLLIEEFLEDKSLSDVFMRGIFKSKTWAKLDEGTVDDETAIKEMEDNLPDSIKGIVRKVMYHWYDTLYPVIGMEELIKELKEKGYNIYLLSNAPNTLHNYINRVPGSKYMTSYFCSADYKLVKPNPAIYQKFFEVNNLVANECLFIDDLEANVKSSISQGMDGIVFKGPQNLKEELVRRNIL